MQPASDLRTSERGSRASLKTDSQPELPLNGVRSEADSRLSRPPPSDRSSTSSSLRRPAWRPRLLSSTRAPAGLRSALDPSISTQRLRALRFASSATSYPSNDQLGPLQTLCRRPRSDQLGRSPRSRLRRSQALFRAAATLRESLRPSLRFAPLWPPLAASLRLLCCQANFV